MRGEWESGNLQIIRVESVERASRQDFDFILYLRARGCSRHFSLCGSLFSGDPEWFNEFATVTAHTGDVYFRDEFLFMCVSGGSITWGQQHSSRSSPRRVLYVHFWLVGLIKSKVAKGIFSVCKYCKMTLFQVNLYLYGENLMLRSSHFDYTYFNESKGRN